MAKRKCLPTLRRGSGIKSLEEIITLRKQDTEDREEHETLVDVYVRAMEGGGAMVQAA